MSWKEKHKKSRESGELLAENGLLNSAAHCYYYGIVQHCLYSLLAELEMNYEKIEKARKEGSKKHKGFHNWIKNTTFVALSNPKDKRNFNKLFGRIKRLRIKADYETEFISQNEIGLMQKYAQTISEILERNLNTNKNSQ